VTCLVVPYRSGGKTRLPAGVRRELGWAMLGDVVEAALEVGRVLVVSDDPLVVPPGALAVVDPGGGQGAAVAAALARVDGPALVVNADVPCVTPQALRRLAASGAAFVAAADGTTNALAFPDPALFRDLYGPGSAARFEAAGLVPVPIPELRLDVDTLDDLHRVRLPLGLRTRGVAEAHQGEARVAP
jgi:2-phospho-L-lactate guanylyltransferase (CobY/MobA/RfbA family)